VLQDRAGAEDGGEMRRRDCNGEEEEEMGQAADERSQHRLRRLGSAVAGATSGVAGVTTGVAGATSGAAGGDDADPYVQVRSVARALLVSEEPLHTASLIFNTPPHLLASAWSRISVSGAGAGDGGSGNVGVGEGGEGDLMVRHTILTSDDGGCAERRGGRGIGSGSATGNDKGGGRVADAVAEERVRMPDSALGSPGNISTYFEQLEGLNAQGTA
jgi:hypothetical protein